MKLELTYNPLSFWKGKARAVQLAIVFLLAAWSTHPAWAMTAIPASERSVLVELYYWTGGPHWNNNLGWNGPSGTECSWYGVTCVEPQLCDPRQHCIAHVVGIQLGGNNLNGLLITTNLNALPHLTDFEVDKNQLTDWIPDFSGTAMSYFDASKNSLTGGIPNLHGLGNLKYFDVSNNHLTGMIPCLSTKSPCFSGLNNLSLFNVGENLLTGAIPVLTGLPDLQGFNATNNQSVIGEVCH